MDKSGDIVMKTQAIFSLPMSIVCDAFDKLVAETNPQELLHSLEYIVNLIFGPNTRWDMRCITSKTDEVTFRFLVDFLSPNGPVFRLIYKLVMFWDTKTVYNLTEYLTWIRDLFDDGMPEYFMDKVSLDEKTRRITHMSLNAFELYFFHFSHYVASPWLPTVQCPLIHESVYMDLATQYLTTFLPAHGSEVLPYVHATYSSLRSTLPRVNQAFSRYDLNPCKYRHSALRDFAPQPYIYNMMVWRSEAVFYILSYVWLWYGKQDLVTGVITREPPPSVETVRTVRAMVKHFHYFANSAVGDLSAMDGLKRIVRPVSSPKIYHFLRRSIYNWPLDISFRVILECWLSFIQPWRYTDFIRFKKSSNLSQEVASEHRVDKIWQTYISENMLAYTHLYQQVLPRFFQLDLTSAQNATMLNRFTKVFAQPNLNVLIAEVEACIVDRSCWETAEISEKKEPPPPPDPKMDGMPLVKLVKNSHDVALHGKEWYSRLYGKLPLLEGNNFNYAPMYRQDNEEAYKFLDAVKVGYISAYLSMVAAERATTHEEDTFFAKLMRFLLLEDSHSLCLVLEERTKVVLQLRQSLLYIARCYNIPEPPLLDPKDLSSVAASSKSQFVAPTVTKVSSERWQVRLTQGRRRKFPQYQGDPDLMPIMSHECAFAVRMLHKLCSSINSKYSLELCRLYNQPGFAGGVARQIISAPKVIHYYNKYETSFGHAQLQETVLPPRLSLRWMGSYSFLGMVITLMLISQLLLGSWTTLLLSLYVLWLIYIAIRALLEPVWPLETMEVDEPSEPTDVFDLNLSSSVGSQNMSS